MGSRRKSRPKKKSESNQRKRRLPLVGSSVPRKEGRKKVTGEAKYIDDLHFPGMWYGVTVRSPVSRGRLRQVAFEGNIPWKEICVVTAKDIPGQNYVALIKDDQPYLVDKEINHPEEPVLLLAHPDRYLLEEARRNIRFDIETLPPVLSLEESLQKKEVIWGDDNIFKSFLVEKGDVDSAWTTADHVVSGEYHTGAQEQLYIETNGVIAVASPKLGVTLWGSMQCPYYVHKALMPLFGLPAEKVRVIQTETGGGFGGKEEYPSVLAGHAALLAWKCGHSVKMIYDRAEDMVATTKRHPSRTRIKAATTKSGKLLALDIDFVIDGGAYLTLSPVVLSRGTIHAAGAYDCPNVRIRSVAVATNSPPHGAFRGFGAPQSLFALERHMDVLARAVGLTPEVFRKMNFLEKNKTTATGQTIHDPIDMKKLLDRALAESDYRKKQKRFKKENPGSRIKRGMGIATFLHGAGFTGSGEKMMASVAGVEATTGGKIRVLSANTEIGQGTNTIFTQVVADALGLDYEDIEVAQPDTAQVPNSGPTVASRTTMVVGKLVEEAALGLRATLVQSGYLKDPYSPSEFRKACQNYLLKFGKLKSFSEYRQPGHIQWDDKTYRGDAYGAYAWAVYIAEVSVDTVTFEAKVEDFVALQEVGKVIHPILAAGQIEGGVAQAIGYALYEKVNWKDGRMINNKMTNYIMPTARDLPPIRVFFEELPYAHGPAGAKGIGELPMDGPAPAILNAIREAIGVEINTIPALPEDLMKAMESV